MTIVTVVQDVCAVIGVEIPPSSVFTNISTNRTMQEMVALANEMSQRIAYDLRDWTMLRVQSNHLGDGVTKAFPLPADYLRMTLTGKVRTSTNPQQPLEFINDFDQWIERRLSNAADNSYGEWTIYGGQIVIDPAPAVGVTITYPYISKNCVALVPGGGFGDRFTGDLDYWRLGNERVLRLGMIWQWKAQKGSPYAEDMGTYSDALSMMMGKDSPAPIYVGSQNISAAARVAYPGPLDPAGWTWPLSP